MYQSTTMSYNNEDFTDITGVLNQVDAMQNKAWNVMDNEDISWWNNQNSASDIRKQTEELKRQNAKKKSEIMKPRRPVLVLLDQDPPFIRETRDMQKMLEDWQEEAMGFVEQMVHKY